MHQGAEGQMKATPDYSKTLPHMACSHLKCKRESLFVKMSQDYCADFTAQSLKEPFIQKKCPKWCQLEPVRRLYLVFTRNISMLWLTFRFNDNIVWGEARRAPLMDELEVIAHSLRRSQPSITPFQKHHRFERGVINACAHICVCLKFNMSRTLLFMSLHKHPIPNVCYYV